MTTKTDISKYDKLPIKVGLVDVEYLRKKYIDAKVSMYHAEKALETVVKQLERKSRSKAILVSK